MPIYEIQRVKAVGHEWDGMNIEVREIINGIPCGFYSRQMMAWGDGDRCYPNRVDRVEMTAEEAKALHEKSILGKQQAAADDKAALMEVVIEACGDSLFKSTLLSAIGVVAPDGK